MLKWQKGVSCKVLSGLEADQQVTAVWTQMMDCGSLYQDEVRIKNM